MKLILRPAMPPWSLIIRKYASEHFAMVPKAETGPLSDVVHPILISVAVTPGVSSPREVPASATTPAATEPASRERRSSKVMLSSPVTLNLSGELRAVAEFNLEQADFHSLASTR